MVPRRKKLKIRLPKFKPEPEPAAKVCVVCQKEVSGWMWHAHKGHPDICIHCQYIGAWPPPKVWSAPTLDDHVIHSAMSIVKRLQNGDKQKTVYRSRAAGKTIQPDGVHG
jgi:hypothetical protein